MHKLSQLVGESTVIVLKVCPLRNMPLIAYSPRQTSLVVSIWITLEIKKVADNQNNSIILLIDVDLQNMLKKKSNRFSYFCLRFTGQKVHGRFRNGSIILVSKETVRLRRWESVKRKICFKVELPPWKVWKLTHFQLFTPHQGEFR